MKDGQPWGKVTSHRKLFQSLLCINALPTHLFYFLADQHHFFPVGQCAGKQVMLASFAPFESFAQFSHGGGEVAYGQIDLSESGQAAEFRFGKTDYVIQAKDAAGEI